MKTINIARDYSRTPGARHRKDGPYSGQQFREEFLEPHFKSATNPDKLQIILDGAAGYATSFLEESFGGLARMCGPELCLKTLVFVCEEDPMVIEEILGYIKDCRA